LSVSNFFVDLAIGSVDGALKSKSMQILVN